MELLRGDVTAGGIAFNNLFSFNNLLVFYQQSADGHGG
jgi:hypothetical protein